MDQNSLRTFLIMDFNYSLYVENLCKNITPFTYSTKGLNIDYLDFIPRIRDILEKRNTNLFIQDTIQVCKLGFYAVVDRYLRIAFVVNPDDFSVNYFTVVGICAGNKSVGALMELINACITYISKIENSFHNNYLVEKLFDKEIIYINEDTIASMVNEGQGGLLTFSVAFTKQIVK